MSRPKTKRIAREVALWVGGALGALCLVSLVAGWVLHVTPLVFASGSMTPDYPVGSLGVARTVPASSIAIGDVVSVVDDRGVRVTHRVVATSQGDGNAVLTLQGDTNDIPDAQTYQVASAPRVVFDVPYAGYALNLAASPYGVAVSAAAVMGLLFLGFGGSAGGPNRRRVRTLVPVGVASVLVVGGVAGASGAAPWAFTSAYWTDSATATATAVAGVSDTVAPVLSSPIPADGAKAAAYTTIDTCSANPQLCVTATDTGGSNLSTVTVKLLRTNTNECWSGSAWVSGSACSPLTMTPVTAGSSQYKTTSLTLAAMTVGIYQATYVATDGALNSTTLVTKFYTDATAPVIATAVPPYGPAEGQKYASSNSGTNSWRQSCQVADNVMCVTATDTGGVGVDTSGSSYTLLNTSNNTCWNGTAFVAGTGCSVSGLSLSATYPNVYYSAPVDPTLLGGGSGFSSYTITWRIKDLAGNQSTQVVNFQVK